MRGSFYKLRNRRIPRKPQGYGGGQLVLCEDTVGVSQGQWPPHSPWTPVETVPIQQVHQGHEYGQGGEHEKRDTWGTVFTFDLCPQQWDCGGQTSQQKCPVVKRQEWKCLIECTISESFLTWPAFSPNFFFLLADLSRVMVTFLISFIKITYFRLL